MSKPEDDAGPLQSAEPAKTLLEGQVGLDGMIRFPVTVSGAAAGTRGKSASSRIATHAEMEGIVRLAKNASALEVALVSSGKEVDEEKAGRARAESKLAAEQESREELALMVQKLETEAEAGRQAMEKMVKQEKKAESKLGAAWRLAVALMTRTWAASRRRMKKSLRFQCRATCTRMTNQASLRRKTVLRSRRCKKPRMTSGIRLAVWT